MSYQVLYPFKKHFCCAQAPHFLVFCWLVVALIHDPDKGTLKGLKPYLILVTNLTEVSAGVILSMYAWRWGVELTIKELKSGVHLGQMQVTKEAERVAHSGGAVGVGLAVPGSIVWA